ncbi:MAG: PA2779 family protein [Thermodesulfobacteriota bacterium]
MRQMSASRWTRRLTVVLVALMTLVGMVPPLEAGFVPSESSLDPQMRAKDLAAVQRVLENKLVGEQLKAMGYSEQEISQRLAALSDEEMHSLSVQLQSVEPAGGLGTAIAILAIIALVLIILRLVGKRVVVSD